MKNITASTHAVPRTRMKTRRFESGDERDGLSSWLTFAAYPGGTVKVLGSFL